MVREIVTRAWCDLHMLNDERAEMSETHEVTLDGDAFVLDLCPEHVAAFDAFASLIRTGSAKVAKSKVAKSENSAGRDDQRRTDGEPRAKHSKHERRCLVCSSTLHSQGSFKAHVKTLHGSNLGEVYGVDCPLCGEHFQTVQALGIHGSRRHIDVGGVHDVATMFMVAAEQGDPYGVVAARVEKVAHMPNARPWKRRAKVAEMTLVD